MRGAHGARPAPRNGGGTRSRNCRSTTTRASLGRIEGTATVERCLSKALNGCEGSARLAKFRGMKYRTGIDFEEKILTIAYANPEDRKSVV